LKLQIHPKEENMDIGKSFTYIMEDPNWIMKILIGGLVSLVPIVNFAALGYMVTVLKNVADGQPQPLPEWGNFGEYFMKGLYVLVGALVYIAPILILYCCMMVIPIVLGGAGSAAGRDTGSALAGVGSIISMCLGCLMFLFALAMAVMFPAALTRYAVTNTLSVFWDFRGNFDLISKNLGNYIMAILIVWVAGFVASFGIILCVIGVIFTSFWSQLVGAHVYAQFWRASQGQVAAA
jgi:hypothetical protein